MSSSKSGPDRESEQEPDQDGRQSDRNEVVARPYAAEPFAHGTEHIHRAALDPRPAVEQDSSHAATPARGQCDDDERDHRDDVHGDEYRRWPSPLGRDGDREEQPDDDQADSETIQRALHDDRGEDGPESLPSA